MCGAHVEYVECVFISIGGAFSTGSHGKSIISIGIFNFVYVEKILLSVSEIKINLKRVV